MIYIYLLFTTLIILVVKFWGSFNKRKRLPPGPINWPLVGNLFEIKLAHPQYPHLALTEMAKKYGKVMGVGFGMNYSVILSGYEEIKDIWSRSETSEQRYEFPYVKDRSFNKSLGLIWSGGDVWREMRRFTVKTLIEFGFGKKKSMDVFLEEESIALVQEIREFAQENNGSWEVSPNYLATISLNVIWSLVAGERFNHNDEKLLANIQQTDMFSEICGHSNLYNAFPFLKRLCPKLVHYDVHMETHRDIQSWAKGIVDDVRARRSQRPDKDAQNFVEVFIDKIENHSEELESNFTDDQLVVVLMDIFFAGAETTSMTLNWAILFLTLYPNVQRKLQKEIRNVQSSSSYISLLETAKMPYLRAVILEVIRLGNVVPIPLPRLASEDIHFNEYIIPKGTPIYGSWNSIFTDKEAWGDPEVFRPERFLDSDNKILDEPAVKVSSIFGFGRRKCLGEVITWDSLNAFIVAIFGNFTTEVIPDREPSAKNPIAAITVKPRPYTIRILSNHNV